MEAAQLGIDGGSDDAGKHADCKFTGNKEFEDLIRYYLKSDNLEMAAYVAFATETFGSHHQMKLKCCRQLRRIIQSGAIYAIDLAKKERKKKENMYN